MDGVKGFLGGVLFLLLVATAYVVDAVKRLGRKTRAGWEWIARK